MLLYLAGTVWLVCSFLFTLAICAAAHKLPEMTPQMGHDVGSDRLQRVMWP